MSGKSSETKRALGKLDYGLLVIFIMPLILLSINRTWIFSSHGLADPWIYLGHFLRLEQHLNVFTGTYYITRLSWIIPGYLVYKLFPPLIANYVLHLGFYYTAVISLYLILKLTVNRRAALLAAILMGCYSYFLVAIGWDYVDGAGITYFLVTVLMLTCAGMVAHNKVWLYLSGFFYAALIYSNTGWGVFTPSLAVYYFSINHIHRKNSVLTSLVFPVIGFLCITLLLCTVSYTINRQFLFFLPSLTFSIETINQPNPWKADWKTWFPYATWLILPCLTFLVSIITLLSNWLATRFTKLTISNPLTGYLQLFFILNFLTMIILEIRGTVVLQLTFYASYLIPPMFLAIGSQMESIANRFKPQHYLLITFSIVTLALLPYSPWFDKVYVYILSSLLCVIGLYLLFFTRIISQKRLVTALIALVLIFNLYSFASDQTIWVISGNEPDQKMQFALKSQVSNPNVLQLHPADEDTFLASVEAQNFLKVVDPGANLLFWYNYDESPVYRSISSACLWGYRLAGEKFPRLGLATGFPDPQPTIEQLRSIFKVFPRVVILSKRKDVFQEARQSLNQADFDAKFLSKQEVQQGDFSLMMTFIEIIQK
ncbi:MAG: hypothetical protein HC851_23570 [Acaryochloris sp. RU_4_1]|nr:hypothetical protein [Acaryochloris sp. RU_4_1]